LNKFKTLFSSSCTQDSTATAVMTKAGVIFLGLFLGLYCIFSTVSCHQEESTGAPQDGKCTKIASYELIAEQNGNFIT